MRDDNPNQPGGINLDSETLARLVAERKAARQAGAEPGHPLSVSTGDAALDLARSLLASAPDKTRAAPATPTPPAGPALPGTEAEAEEPAADYPPPENPDEPPLAADDDGYAEPYAFLPQDAPPPDTAPLDQPLAWPDDAAPDALYLYGDVDAPPGFDGEPAPYPPPPYDSEPPPPYGEDIAGEAPDAAWPQDGPYPTQDGAAAQAYTPNGQDIYGDWAAAAWVSPQPEGAWEGQPAEYPADAAYYPADNYPYPPGQEAAPLYDADAASAWGDSQAGLLVYPGSGLPGGDFPDGTDAAAYGPAGSPPYQDWQPQNAWPEAGAPEDTPGYPLYADTPEAAWTGEARQDIDPPDGLQPLLSGDGTEAYLPAGESSPAFPYTDAYSETDAALPALAGADETAGFYADDNGEDELFSEAAPDSAWEALDEPAEAPGGHVQTMPASTLDWAPPRKPESPLSVTAILDEVRIARALAERGGEPQAAAEPAGGAGQAHEPQAGPDAPEAVPPPPPEEGPPDSYPPEEPPAAGPEPGAGDAEAGSAEFAAEPDEPFVPDEAPDVPADDADEPVSAADDAETAGAAAGGAEHGGSEPADEAGDGEAAIEAGTPFVPDEVPVPDVPAGSEDLPAGSMDTAEATEDASDDAEPQDSRDGEKALPDDPLPPPSPDEYPPAPESPAGLPLTPEGPPGEDTRGAIPFEDAPPGDPAPQGGDDNETAPPGPLDEADAFGPDGAEMAPAASEPDGSPNTGDEPYTEPLPPPPFVESLFPGATDADAGPGSLTPAAVADEPLFPSWDTAPPPVPAQPPLWEAEWPDSNLDVPEGDSTVQAGDEMADGAPPGPSDAAADEAKPTAETPPFTQPAQAGGTDIPPDASPPSARATVPGAAPPAPEDAFSPAAADGPALPDASPTSPGPPGPQDTAPAAPFPDASAARPSIGQIQAAIETGAAPPAPLPAEASPFPPQPPLPEINPDELFMDDVMFDSAFFEDGSKTVYTAPSRARQPSRGRPHGHTPRKRPPVKRKRKGRAAGIIFKTLGIFLVVLVSVAGLLFGAITVICKGPFPTYRELFVVSVTETSAAKFLAYIYFSEEEVQEILAANTVIVPDEVTDTSTPFEPPPPDRAIDDIEIIEVSGSTYKGKMMIIQDPSRVRLATIDRFGSDVYGKRIEDHVADNGAVAGINAGGFADDGGVGKGGQPLGLLIRDGKILSGSAATYCNVIGISFDNKLIVGEMTGQAALDLGVRDAVYFTPTLIVNGNPSEIGGTGSGLNPRTCIGQRADGAMLFLVIDGRQPHSVGATMEDCLQIMQEYEAVNAANLDGGSSSVMVYEGEIINVCASLYGSRTQPSAFIVE